jgi:hypothetical protein
LKCGLQNYSAAKGTEYNKRKRKENKEQVRGKREIILK